MSSAGGDGSVELGESGPKSTASTASGPTSASAAPPPPPPPGPHQRSSSRPGSQRKSNGGDTQVNGPSPTSANGGNGPAPKSKPDAINGEMDFLMKREKSDFRVKHATSTVIWFLCFLPYLAAAAINAALYGYIYFYLDIGTYYSVGLYGAWLLFVVIVIICMERTRESYKSQKELYAVLHKIHHGQEVISIPNPNIGERNTKPFVFFQRDYTCSSSMQYQRGTPEFVSFIMHPAVKDLPSKYGYATVIGLLGSVCIAAAYYGVHWYSQDLYGSIVLVFPNVIFEKIPTVHFYTCVGGGGAVVLQLICMTVEYFEHDAHRTKFDESLGKTRSSLPKTGPAAGGAVDLTGPSKSKAGSKRTLNDPNNPTGPQQPPGTTTVHSAPPPPPHSQPQQQQQQQQQQQGSNV